ncbi:MAG: hypothetical protein WKF97_06815 [Chitinophagaceae bacterium]
MEESFELSVEYNNQEKLLPVKIMTMGYSYKIFVNVEGIDVILEPDEERHFRAIIDPIQNSKLPAQAYIIAITKALETLLRG